MDVSCECPEKMRRILSTACLLLVTLILLFTSMQSSNHRPSSKPIDISQKQQLSVRQKRDINSYYDFLINEWSFKFWAAFQLVTIAILFYSTFAAIYYAKYTYLRNPPTGDDLWIRRALRAIRRPPDF